MLIARRSTLGGAARRGGGRCDGLGDWSRCHGGKIGFDRAHPIDQPLERALQRLEHVLGAPVDVRLGRAEVGEFVLERIDVGIRGRAHHFAHGGACRLLGGIERAHARVLQLLHEVGDRVLDGIEMAEAGVGRVELLG